MSALPWVTSIVLTIHILAVTWMSLQERTPLRTPTSLQVTFLDESPLPSRPQPVLSPPPPEVQELAVEETPPPAMEEPAPEAAPSTALAAIDKPPAVMEERSPPPKKATPKATAQPKPTPKASPKNQAKKPAPAKAKKPAPAAAPTPKLSPEARAALARLRKTSQSIPSASPTVAKVTIPELGGQGRPSMSRKQEQALGKLTSQLQNCAILPERGQIQMRITVDGMGRIQALQVLKSQSARNQKVLEQALRQLTLDVSEAWDGTPLVLVVTFSHA